MLNLKLKKGSVRKQNEEIRVCTASSGYNEIQNPLIYGTREGMSAP
jgi:hypothetical protein